MKFQKKTVLAAGVAFSLALFAHPVCVDADKVLEEVKSSVKSGWKQLERCSEKISALREERKRLPSSSSWRKLWLNTNKSDQDAKIRAQLLRVRELLLSTNARKILERVDDLDEDIRKVEEKIREVQTDRQLADESEKGDYNNIHVVYTKEHETADAYIERIANDIGRNESVRVVTSDSLIRVSALRSGVLRTSSTEFRAEVQQVYESLSDKDAA